MKQQITQRVLADRGLRPAERILYVKLLDHRHSETGECFPGDDRLVKTLNMSRSTIKKARRELIKKGRITVTNGRGRGRMLQYQLVGLEMFENGEKGYLYDPMEKGERRNPLPVKRVTNDAEMGHKWAKKRVADAPPEPREEHLIEQAATERAVNALAAAIPEQSVAGRIRACAVMRCDATAIVLKPNSKSSAKWLAVNLDKVPAEDPTGRRVEIL